MLLTYGTVTLTLTNPNGVTKVSTWPFQLRAQDSSISITVKEVQGTIPTSTVDLEQYVNISGAVFSAQLNDTSSGVQLVPRISLQSTYFTGEQHVYNYLEVSGRRTYGVDVNSDITYVIYFEDGQYKSSFAGLGSGAFLSFTVVQLDDQAGIDALVYSLVESGNAQLFCAVYQNGKRISPKFSSGRGFATKLKGHALADNKTFYLLAASEPGEIDLWVVDTTNKNFKRFNSVQGALDFDIVANVNATSNYFNLITVNFEANSLTGYKVRLDTPAISTPIKLALDHNYRLLNLACHYLNGTDFWCAVNTEASFVQEVTLKWDLTSWTTYSHDKFSYYDGFELDIAGDYIFMFAKTRKPGVLSMVILCWKSFRAGGTGHVYYSQKLFVPPNDLNWVHIGWQESKI